MTNQSTDQDLLQPKQHSVSFNGHTFVLETGKIARQANGAVTLTCKNNVLLATACSSKAPSSEVDFLPLTVNYMENLSSNGKTAGGFIKQPGRQNKGDTLTSRMIDRPIRPLFPKGFYDEVQVIISLFSYDETYDPNPLSICAASAALAISSIPMTKTVGAVRVGFVDGEFIINPTPEQKAASKLDLLLAGTHEAVLMIEGYCDFLTEDQVIQAITEGHEAIKLICEGIDDFARMVGKEKDLTTIDYPSDEMFDKMRAFIGNQLVEAYQIREKEKRNDAISAVKEALAEELKIGQEECDYTARNFGVAFKEIRAQTVRGDMLKTRRRIDGRTPECIRPIVAEARPLPTPHGSALFTRGETQALCISVLGNENMVQRGENVDGEISEKFYLHYAFPGYSVGECRRLSAPGRREVGHGMLAQRALTPTLPSSEKFPYVIRIETHVTESNGSSSMASVCGGCLSLMDAGVPIRAPIAGIAMGLILEDDSSIILSDILGDEDALGDMDFKIAGSDFGITAFQMDIKVEGITPEIMEAALRQAKDGRLHILKKMALALEAPRASLAQNAPRIHSIKINPSKIGTLIGPGGKNIKNIQETTGVDINIDDDGTVNVSCVNGDSIDQALTMIEDLTGELKVGEIYEGVVDGIKEFGCFVSLPYQSSALVHISELAHERVADVNDVVKVGDKIKVKIIGSKMGKISASMKAAQKKEKSEV
ncbi:MAG: Polyribonucleotide nucleotidyltransferase [Chlamydiia bacterium]|nr:Polyribonucleotide nucleotidyltransferase [Chlamydiia bacterium]